MMQSVNDVNLAKFLDFDAPLTGTGGEAEIHQWDATYIMNKQWYVGYVLRMYIIYI